MVFKCKISAFTHIISIFAVFFFLLGCNSVKHEQKKDTVVHAQPVIADDAEIKYDRSLRTPILMRGDLSSTKMLGEEDYEKCALLFIEHNKELFNLSNPNQELNFDKMTMDKAGNHHLSFTRHHDNIPIWGDEFKIHFNQEGIIYLMNGRYHSSLPDSFSVIPELDSSEATEIAKNEAKKTENIDTVQEVELVVYPTEQLHYLAYRININNGIQNTKNWDYFVDAAKGSIIHKYNKIKY